MATINAYDRLKLSTLATRFNNGSLMETVELLVQFNPMLSDMIFREANDGLGEKISQRTSLPAGTYRGVNQGVAKEKSGTKPLRETVSHLEGRSNTDILLVDRNSNPIGYRRQEDAAFIEGLAQTSAATMIYGNVDTDPEEFNGLATRRNSLSSDYVYDNGGTGSDLTSIFLVKYGFNAIYGIYPVNSQVGVIHTDLGKRTVQDGDSNDYEAYVSLFTVEMGIVEKDPRYLRRIANIETSGSVNIFSDDLLIQAINDLPGGSRDVVIYVSKAVKTQMDILAKDKSNVSYTSQEVFGVPTTFFQGIPVRRNDAILDTEDAVV